MQLPTYIQNDSQENYHEEMNQTLRNGLGDSGFTIPNLTNTDVAEVLLLDPPMPPGTLWFNVSINGPYGALQFLALDGSVRTVQDM